MNFIESVLPIIIYFIIFIKLIFITSATLHFYFSRTGKPEHKEYDKKALYWKERTELIFSVSTATLLIFIFNPWYSNMKYLNREIKLIFYLFGWIIIITSDWKTFFTDLPVWWNSIRSKLK